MPNWVWKAIGTLLLIALVIGVLLVGYAVITIKNDQPLLDPQATAQPTIDVTKVAAFTPTPGPGSKQMATAVVIAKPDPYVEWTPGDAEAFIKALRDKAILSEQDINIAAQLSSPGEGHICLGYSAFFKIKLDTYCKISLTWTEWALAYHPQNIEVKVEDGSIEQDTSKLPLSADGTHYIQQPKAKVTIVIKDLGIVGPTTRFGQEFDFYKDLNAIWKLKLDLKELFTGQDMMEKARAMTAETGDLAKADSFAPLQEDNSRSAVYSDQLYQKFVDSLTTPGQGHIYNRLLDYATLVANDKTAKDGGYAGLESLTVIVPAKPNTPCEYVYAEDMVTKVLPEKYCSYTFKASNITQEAKQELINQLVSGTKDPSVDQALLIKRILEIR